MQVTTVKLFPNQVEDFSKRLLSINKKAKAFGVETVEPRNWREVLYVRKSAAIGDDIETWYEEKAEGARYEHGTVFTTLLHVDINTPVVKSGNWDVVARIRDVQGVITPTPMSNNIADVDKAVELARADRIDCDHCKAKRRRSDSFLLSSGGKYMQVGTSCLKDFTGHDAASILFLASLYYFFKSYEDLPSGGRGWNVKEAFATRDIVQASLKVIEEFGWVSKVRATEEKIESTARRVYAALTSGEDFAPATDDTDALIAHFTTLSSVTEYTGKLKAFLAMDIVSADKVSIIASAIPAYYRDMERAKEVARARKSVHVGTVNDKVELELTYVDIKHFNTDFGWSALVKFVDADGNHFIWSTSTDTDAWDKRYDQKVVVKGTVKAHTEYNGVAQTELTRCKLTWPEVQPA